MTYIEQSLVAIPDFCPHLSDVVRSFQGGLLDLIPQQGQQAWMWVLCPGSVLLSPAGHLASATAEFPLLSHCLATQQLCITAVQW